MKIEHIHIKNFRVFHDTKMENIPPLAFFIGRNGSGKSTVFQVFGFLKDALQNNVNIALQKLGGYKEVVTREHYGEPISIEIKFRLNIAKVNRLVTYYLEIALDDKKKPVVLREFLRYKRRQQGPPFHSLDFKEGEGYAIGNEEDFEKTGKKPDKIWQKLHNPDILAIKGLGQFQQFKVANAFRNLIENWHISDFHIAAARQKTEVGFAEHLSERGDNLPLVAQHLHKHHPKVFADILNRFSKRVPGMEEVTAKVTDEGSVLLRFKDGSYKDPFIARHVSDGTIKMFAYLVLLHDPKPRSFLCMEEPENQLYPKLFADLVDELREYAGKDGGQVFVSSHSPEMLNDVNLDEAFFLRKKNGKTKIYAVSQNPQIKSLVDAGDKLGWLWSQDILDDELENWSSDL